MEQPRMTEMKILKHPDDFDPIESQRELQNLMGHYALTQPTYGTVLESMRMNKEAIDVEYAEILDWLACWKHWKESHRKRHDELIVGDDRLEVLFEVVDILHFVFNMAIVLGVSWDMLMDIFYTKQQENFRRQREGY